MSKLSKEDIILANKIADRIKSLRTQDTGDKLINFANKHHIDKQEISRWEGHVKKDIATGKTKGRGITVYTIKKFCDLISISLNDFFDDELFRE